MSSYLPCVGLVCLAFGVVCFAQGTPSAPACLPAPVIQEAIAATGYSSIAPAGTLETARQASRLRIVVERFPTDFFGHAAYFEAAGAGIGMPDPIIASLKKSLDAAPSDPAAAYLYALSLVGKRTAETVDVLTKLIAEHRNFAHPHRLLATIYRSQAFRDPAKLAMHVEAYLHACPGNPDAYALLRRLEASEFLAHAAVQFREFLAGRTDRDALLLYPSLWSVELKLAKASERDERLNRIAEDLNALARLDTQKYPGVSAALREGYRLTGNRHARQRLLASDLSRGSRVASYVEAQSAWVKTHPYPKPDALADARRAYFHEVLRFTDSWSDRVPDLWGIWTTRLEAMVELSGYPVAELLRVGEQALNVLREQPSGGSEGPFPYVPHRRGFGYLQVARLWAQQGVALDRVPTLVREDFVVSGAINAFVHSDLARIPQAVKDTQPCVRLSPGYRVLVQAHARLGQSREAREVLAEWAHTLETCRANLSSALQASKPNGEVVAGSADLHLLVAEAWYQEALGLLAVMEGRQLDALAFQMAALHRLATVAEPVAELYRPGLLAHARRIWNGLGGTGDGWQSWVAPAGAREMTRQSAINWTKLNRQLPDFNIQDQHGRTWTRNLLLGRTTFINVWATWCVPCREELPYVQKLQERMKDRADVQVISLNMDEDTSLVEPFLRTHDLHIPVLAGRGLVRSMSADGALPRSWVVDATGTIRSESIGFLSIESERWFQLALSEIESAQRANAAKR